MRVLVLGLFVALAFANCVPDPLGAAQVYNLYSLGPVFGCNSDVEGRVAADGDVNFSSYSVGLKATDTQTYSLVSSGNVQWTDGTSWHGGVTGANVGLQSVGIVVGGTLYDSDCCSDDDCSFCSSGATTTSPFDFVTTNSRLKQLSQFWSSLPNSGAGAGHIHTITLTCYQAPNSVNVFNGVNVNSEITNIVIACDSTQTVIINYSSDVTALQGLGFTLQTGADQSKIIHHFTGATLSISGVGVPGTVFAPFSAVTFNGGVTYGSIVAGSFGDNLETCNGGQVNHVPFSGCAPVPEPAFNCCVYEKHYTIAGPHVSNKFCVAGDQCEDIGNGWGLVYANSVASCDACCVCE